MAAQVPLVCSLFTVLSPFLLSHASLSLWLLRSLLHSPLPPALPLSPHPYPLWPHSLPLPALLPQQDITIEYLKEATLKASAIAADSLKARMDERDLLFSVRKVSAARLAELARCGCLGVSPALATVDVVVGEGQVVAVRIACGQAGLSRRSGLVCRSLSWDWGLLLFVALYDSNKSQGAHGVAALILQTGLWPALPHLSTGCASDSTALCRAGV